MPKLFRITSIFLSAIILLAACNLPLGKKNTPAAANEQTIIAQTVSAAQTALARNTTPSASLTPFATFTSAPTTSSNNETPVVEGTPQPIYKVGFVTDVTIPDNTVIEPGKTFKKTWRLRNDGTGTWNTNFKLIFASGDSMSGPASKPIDQAVPPGETIDVSLDLIAPSVSKTYKGNWMLQTDAGINFGVGPSSSSAFTVVIKVEQMFAVTNAVPSAAPAAWSGACPVTIKLTATITSTAPGTVAYYYVTPLGNTPSQEMAFTEAGTKTSPSYDLQIPGNTSGTIQVYVDTPNHQLFAAVANVNVTCTP